MILAAADPELARTIREHFRAKAVRKIYQALVFGRPRAAGGNLARPPGGGEGRGPHPHRPGIDAGRERDEPWRAPARGLSLLRLEPRTGRSHQLRVQCAKRGLPIVGDQTYGDFRRNRDFAKRTGAKRLFLHSLATSFDYEFSGRKFHFEAEAPLPPEFESLTEG